MTAISELDENKLRSPEEIEHHWLETVYAGDHVPQLTVRAVLTGCVLGALMAMSNLYVVLKTGWSLGVTITAAVLAFSFWSLVGRIVPRLSPFGPLENNAMQSVASAAGFMTGGGTAAAIPALLLTSGYRMPALEMMIWIGVLAALGVFVAIPLKRQMINIEQLRFPSGIASAETVRSLHAEGSEAQTRARALARSGLLGAAVAMARDALHWIPEKLAGFGAAAAPYTFQIEMSTIMVGAGALMGMRVALSQLLGAFICYGVLAPWALSQGAIDGALGYKNILKWAVWPGAAMMLTAGLLQFAMQWRSLGRAFADLTRALQPSRTTDDDPLARIEVPSSWFVGGVAVLGPLVVYLQWRLFAIPLWMGVIAVAMSLVIAVVAARSTGETDTTPTGALGKLVQLVFGTLHPGNTTTNLMTAQASAGIAIHASDLLTDLKSGYLLGARPRLQFFAQFFGVLAGTAVVVPAYLVLVPDAATLGTRFPAPAAQAWAAVAQLLSNGMHTLHPTAQVGIVVGGVTGIVLALLEAVRPTWKRFLPSPIALGLAFTMPAWNAISMAMGAFAAWALERERPALAALFLVPVASGLIAGESLLGVCIALKTALLGD